MFASVLVLSGQGCGSIWDEHTLGDDYNNDSFNESYRNQMGAEIRRSQEEKEKAAQQPRRAPTGSYSELAGKTPDEIRWMAPLFIPVLTLDGERFPFPSDQFTKAQPDKCEGEHYHGDVGYTLELKTVHAPADPCGFGNAVTLEEVDAEKLIKWIQGGPQPQRR